MKDYSPDQRSRRLDRSQAATGLVGVAGIEAGVCRVEKVSPIANRLPVATRQKLSRSAALREGALKLIYIYAADEIADLLEGTDFET